MWTYLSRLRIDHLNARSRIIVLKHDLKPGPDILEKVAITPRIDDDKELLCWWFTRLDKETIATRHRIVIGVRLRLYLGF